MIDQVTAAIREMIDSLGSGILPPDGPQHCLPIAISALTDVGAATIDLAEATSAGWSGAAAVAAEDKIRGAGCAADALARHGSELNAVLGRACETVRRGSVDLTDVLASFTLWFTTALPTLGTPVGQAALVAVADEHLARAAAVVTRVRSELDALAAETRALVPTPTLPTRATVVGTLLRAVTEAVPPAAGSATVVDPVSSLGPVGPRSAHHGDGAGVQVTLPDGSVAVAPNDRAASAVRTALELRGTPYVWGGTSPDTGLDCSGLTQYAYGQAGVDIPRLAQDQDIGTPVGVDDLAPGDLAVWDGHVAMVVGNGQLVEAGDPVEVGPIRTANAGMTFHGFYRPTA